MGVSAQMLSSRVLPQGWLVRRDWDLKFISFSAILVPVPYLVYLLFLQLDPLVGPVAEAVGTTVDDLSRNLVNGFVALVVGGPHMYATFTRTALDHDFAKAHTRLIWSSMAVPVVVIALALFNLPLLLTLFFSWASIHVLHQVIYITELYNNRREVSLSPIERYADYGVILTALYPIALYKMVTGEFVIGFHDIGAQVETLVGYFGLSMGAWMVVLGGLAFAGALSAWIVVTFLSWRAGTLHGPKTLFVVLTVTASFFVPVLGNLDTAFQGMNFWHSLQYLALTWMLNNVRQRRGELDNSPMVKRLSEDRSERRFYYFNVMMMVANIMYGVAVFGILYVLFGKSFDFAFDRSYYIAVLSVLWMHYYQDHYLFTDTHVIERKAA
jgi:hypothetical protein